ncbi:MAG: kelch repeat-containing protein [Bacteroidia bacterium]
MYDINAKSWTTGASAPEQFNHFQATEYEGLIWVIGAFYQNNYPSEPPEDNIHIYDPAHDEWIVGPTIPASRRRGSTGLVVYDDKFYVVGGNTIGHNGGYVDWFDEYDPINNTWTPMTSAPRARDHFNAVVIGSKLYAAGGRLTGGTGGTFAPLVEEVDVYNFNTNSWSTLPSTLNIPTPRAGVAAVNFQDQVVVIGGEGNGNAYPNAEAYDPSTSTWTTLDPMNHQRHGTQAIVSGDGIYTTGGSFKQGGGSQTNMEVYGIENPQGSASVAGVMSAPNSVNITQNGSGNIVISHTGGNVGIFIRSLQITNVTGGSFTITDGNPGAGGFLLKTGTSHIIEVSLGNNTAGQSANLVINYGKNSTKTVAINGVASSSASRQITGNAIDMNRQIQVYPNPTDGQPHLQVALSLVESDQVSFRLADLAGKTVLEVENRIVELKSVSVPVGDRQ